MTQLIAPGITVLAQPDGVAASLRGSRPSASASATSVASALNSLSTLSIPCLALCLAYCLMLIACGPVPPAGQKHAATGTAPAVAPPPVPKTLESTLRLDPGVEEIPFYPQIAESRHGDTVAVWEQFDGEHYNIWGNSRRAHQDWGRARLIQANDSGHSYNPRVAINANGQAAAVWVQMNSAASSYAVWSSRLEPGADWARAVRVESGSAGKAERNAGPSYAPDVAIDDAGNAVAAWQQSDGRHVNVRANRFAVGAGWGDASQLERGDGDLGAPHVAVDAGGNAMVVWPRFKLDHSDLWASRYVLGGGREKSAAWEKAQRVDTVRGYVPSPQVVASAAGSPGQFTVLWEQQQGFHSGFGASQFQPGRGWRVAGSECAAQLQALGATTAEPAEALARVRVSPAAASDLCY
jgi:hypothetical protein